MNSSKEDKWKTIEFYDKKNKHRNHNYSNDYQNDNDNYIEKKHKKKHKDKNRHLKIKKEFDFDMGEIQQYNNDNINIEYNNIEYNNEDDGFDDFE